jgi:hypothetical protein
MPILLMLSFIHALPARVARRLSSDDPERGDVPGWVLVTVMTAGIVMALWAIAEPQLRDMLSEALDSVSG